jgi:ArsR family transcriptional regulator
MPAPASVVQQLRKFKADIFHGLAHPSRIAIVEALRDGEAPAGRIIERVGIEPANASQHFAVLRARRIVVGRKEGNQVFYSLRDPVLMKVLDLLKGYFYSQLSETQSMLKEIRDERRTSRKAGGPTAAR